MNCCRRPTGSATCCRAGPDLAGCACGQVPASSVCFVAGQAWSASLLAHRQSLRRQGSRAAWCCLVMVGLTSRQGGGEGNHLRRGDERPVGSAAPAAPACIVQTGDTQCAAGAQGGGRPCLQPVLVAKVVRDAQDVPQRGGTMCRQHQRTCG